MEFFYLQSLGFKHEQHVNKLFCKDYYIEINDIFFFSQVNFNIKLIFYCICFHKGLHFLLMRFYDCKIHMSFRIQICSVMFYCYFSWLRVVMQWKMSIDKVFSDTCDTQIFFYLFEQQKFIAFNLPNALLITLHTTGVIKSCTVFVFN